MAKYKEVSFAFSGAGFLGAYYAGVIVCLKRFPTKFKVVGASGVSAGALAACCLLSEKPVEQFVFPVLSFCTAIRNFAAGSFSPTCNMDRILKRILEDMMPDDILDDVNGRLHLSVTRVRDGRNLVVNRFSSRAELIDCIRASSFVPVFSGLIPPLFRGERCMDGIFTNNSPRITDDTITVMPYGGRADICPIMKTAPKFHINWANTSFAGNWFNLKHFFMTVWPQEIQTHMKFFHKGFKRAMRYLVENDQFRCENCSEIELNYKPCANCHVVRDEHLEKQLPEDIIKIVDQYIKNELKPKRFSIIELIDVVSVVLLPVLLPVQLLIAIIILCIPLLNKMYRLVRKYFITKDVIVVVTVAVLIPIDICSAVANFSLQYVCDTLGVGAGNRSRKSKVDGDVKNRILSVLVMGILAPVEIGSFLFFFTYYIADKLSTVKYAKNDLEQEKHLRGCGEKAKSLVEHTRNVE